MNPITLTLNQDQAQQILQLADAAVRGGGLQYARQAVALMNLLDAAAAAAATPPPVVQEEPQ
jgi:hypothetical protein